jgi:threonine aldolase
MRFFSDNAASVHPKVWEALKAADAPDAAYDGDALSARLDAAFGEVFGTECAALWVATGTAANCLALAALCPPHGGILCHREAHIEVDEGGAPAFYSHGAKLMLVDGAKETGGAKLTPQALAAAVAGIRRDVHQVQPHALSLTQATEYGRVYTPAELADLAAFAAERGLAVHVDGARFANAVAHLGCAPRDACQGAAALTFGCVKNGGMNAEALVLFDPALADLVRYRRKRAGHLQSKGRFQAAQVLALLAGDLWLDNARTANAAAQEIAGACGERLIHPVEANEIFVSLAPAEAAALRGQGFDFYDWPAPQGQSGAARLVTSWNSDPGDVAALARAIRGL